MKSVILYTDGACSGNPGPGGYAAILMFGGKTKHVTGGDPHTTNNRMELMGVIEGLRALKEPCKVSVHSDSAYVIKAFNEGWVQAWLVKGWRTANKKPVLNDDLWKELLDVMEKHSIEWIKVKGHSDNEFNNKCDELARAEIEKIKA